MLGLVESGEYPACGLRIPGIVAARKETSRQWHRTPAGGPVVRLSLHHSQAEVKKSFTNVYFSLPEFGLLCIICWWRAGGAGAGGEALWEMGR